MRQNERTQKPKTQKSKETEIKGETIGTIGSPKPSAPCINCIQNMECLQTNCQTWGLLDIRPKSSEWSRCMIPSILACHHQGKLVNKCIQRLWIFKAMKAVWLFMHYFPSYHAPMFCPWTKLALTLHGPGFASWSGIYIHTSAVTANSEGDKSS